MLHADRSVNRGQLLHLQREKWASEKMDGISAGVVEFDFCEGCQSKISVEKLSRLRACHHQICGPCLFLEIGQSNICQKQPACPYSLCDKPVQDEDLQETKLRNPDLDLLGVARMSRLQGQESRNEIEDEESLTDLIQTQRPIFLNVCVLSSALVMKARVPFYSKDFYVPPELCTISQLTEFLSNRFRIPSQWKEENGIGGLYKAHMFHRFDDLWTDIDATLEAAQITESSLLMVDVFGRLRKHLEEVSESKAREVETVEETSVKESSSEVMVEREDLKEEEEEDRTTEEKREEKAESDVKAEESAEPRSGNEWNCGDHRKLCLQCIAEELQRCKGGSPRCPICRVPLTAQNLCERLQTRHPDMLRSCQQWISGQLGTSPEETAKAAKSEKNDCHDPDILS